MFLGKTFAEKQLEEKGRKYDRLRRTAMRPDYKKLLRELLAWDNAEFRSEPEREAARIDSIERVLRELLKQLASEFST